MPKKLNGTLKIPGFLTLRGFGHAIEQLIREKLKNLFPGVWHVFLRVGVRLRGGAWHGNHILKWEFDLMLPPNVNGLVS